MKKKLYRDKGLNVHLIGVLAIITAIAGPWFDLSVSNHSFVKTYVAGIGIGVLMLLTLWAKRNKVETIFHISTIKIGLLSVFILGTLSIFWTVNVDFMVTKWMIWFTIFCGFVVGYHLKLDEKTLLKLCWGLLIAAFMIAAIGILQYLFDPFTLTQAASPSSTFGNKNMSTQPIVLIWPLTLFLFFSHQTKGAKIWIVALLTSLIMVFIFYTRTRSSWLSIVGESMLVIGFLVLKRHELKSWIGWNEQKTKAGLFAIGLFFILASFDSQGFVLFTEQASSTFEGAGGSGKARFTIWAVAIDMIKAAPVFGTGLGSWFHNEIQGGFGTHNVMSYLHVHNDLLSLGIEAGLSGVALFLVGVVGLVIGSFKIINQNSKITALFFFLLLVALSGSFIQMQFSFPYQLAMPSMLFGLYTGLIAKQSEAFVQPIKLITLKTPKVYHQSIKAFWLIVMTIVIGIYLEWINVYSSLNKINISHKFEQIEQFNPTIYHQEIPKILSVLSQTYWQGGDYDTVITAEENILRYWPNANVSLQRYSQALMKKGRFKKALKAIKHLKKVAGKGNYAGHILELRLYQQTGQINQYRQAFNEFIKIDEKYLSLSSDTYQSMLIFSLHRPEFYKYAVGLYNKHTQYHPYICSVENNIASYYINHKQYKKAKQHVDIAIKSLDSNCLRPQIVQILKKQGL